MLSTVFFRVVEFEVCSGHQTDSSKCSKCRSEAQQREVSLKSSLMKLVKVSKKNVLSEKETSQSRDL